MLSDSRRALSRYFARFLCVFGRIAICGTLFIREDKRLAVLLSCLNSCRPVQQAWMVTAALYCTTPAMSLIVRTMLPVSLATVDTAFAAPCVALARLCSIDAIV